MNLKLSYKHICIIITLLVITIAFSSNINAAEKDKSARRAAQMMQKMKQDMEAEKAAMQTQFDAQKKELEDKLKQNEEENKKLESSLAKEKRKSSRLELTLKTTQTEKEAVEAKLAQTQTALETNQKNLADMTENYRQAQADLKVNDAQRKTQLSTFAQTSKSLQNCEAKNDKLYHYGLDLIKVYDKPSNYEAAIRTEKFTQIKRVELENILQDYRDKLEEEKVSTNNK